MPGPLMLRTRDPVVERRVTRVADRLGTRALQVVAAPGIAEGDEEPVGLLVGVDDAAAVEVVRSWRAAYPGLPIVAYLSLPEPELWKQAEEAGADLVTARGSADRELHRLVEDRLSGRAAARRLRLAAYREFAGRLGYVGRIAETPVGPVAIFHLDNRVHAIADACPHAGASLSEGELDGDVITCPRHGSQFCVRDGARVRGPADLGVLSLKVVVEGGQVFVELPAG